MSRARIVVCRILVAALGIGLISVADTAVGGFNNIGLRNNNVGGVSINVEGFLDQPDAKGREQLRRHMLKNTVQAPGEMARTTELRKISLKRLQAVLDDCVRNKAGVIPDEVKYLAGLQRIEYVLVYPEDNDIVLAGPAEGWEVDEAGNVVGVTTGQPVLHLDDLLVALRSVKQARRGAISCSIDPTPEGRRNLQKLFSQVKRFDRRLLPAIEKAMGPQVISIKGVPEDSHFARVMVAADYRMKRIAMGLDRAPVKGLPSYIQMVKGTPQNMMPRWWLAADFEKVARSEDGLAFRIRGRGVKAMTEDDFIGQDGNVRGSGRKSPIAQKWADLMTTKYDELAQEDAVFGQLRGLMELSIAAAIIDRFELQSRAGCSLPLLASSDSRLVTSDWHAPKMVRTQASAIKRGNNWIVTASGGVEISSHQIAADTKTDPATAKTRKENGALAGARWWWN